MNCFLLQLIHVQLMQGSDPACLLAVYIPHIPVISIFKVSQHTLLLSNEGPHFGDSEPTRNSENLHHWVQSSLKNKRSHYGSSIRTLNVVELRYFCAIFKRELCYHWSEGIWVSLLLLCWHAEVLVVYTATNSNGKIFHRCRRVYQGSWSGGDLSM